jgi:hypothetical protein
MESHLLPKGGRVPRFSDGRPCFVCDPDGCWLWQGARNSGGYPQLGLGGKTQYAHRVYFAALVGVIPDGMQLDHLCRRRACVNPSHLEVVSQRENIRRGSRVKLSPEKVRHIRRAVDCGVKQARLVELYGVGSSTISRIVSGDLWSGL